MAIELPSATVFVVDDDQGLLRLVKKALEREGFTVATAGSGKDALAWLAGNSADLMLLDLKLHDIEGRELIARLADTGRRVPFIIITGQGDERVAVDMMKRGALDYLVKDVDFLPFVPEIVRRGLTFLESERKLQRAQEALRETEARFRVTADHAPVLIWMSGEDKLRAWFNRPWLEFTGRTMEQEVGEGWTKGIHPEDLHRCMNAYSTSFDARKRFAIEYRLRRHDGEWRWVFDSGIPLRDASGHFTGYIGSCIDITERRRLEKEVLDISEMQQRRIGQELHDGLGQQLTAIELMCESVRTDPELGPKQRIKEQLDRVCQFIQKAIGETRALAQGLAPFKVEANGLESALSDLARNTTAAGRMRCSFHSPPQVELKDNEAATHLYRIAQEAVNNALKHSRGSQITVRLSRQNGFLRLEVKDNGKGLARTKQADQGMGLNLMKHRAAVMGADLEVQSRPGKGVTVTCTLKTGQ